MALKLAVSGLTLILLTAIVVASGQSATTAATTSQSNVSVVELTTQPPVAAVNEDELAGREELQTTVKKELQPTEASAGELIVATTSAPSAIEPSEALGQPPKVVSELLGQLANTATNSSATSQKLLQQAGLTGDALPVSVPPNAAKSLDAFAARLPQRLQASFEQMSRPKTSADDDGSIDSLLPKGSSLFNRDSVDPSQLVQMDCHLRNVDYCLAGLMGSAQKMLPETNDEFEVRCDEMKSTASCMAVYNKRCGTFKIFALLAPFSQASGDDTPDAVGQLAQEQRQLMSELGREVKLTAAMEAQLLGRNVSGADDSARRMSVGNLMEICEPKTRGQAANLALRQRLFDVAKCINARVPRLTPCLEDLKTATQVFYEPKRVLPMRPTCCAIARFRACATDALDNICGLSSFQQLVESMTGGSSAPSSPFSMLKTIERVCRQATDHKSPYCLEVLPPSGMRAPQRRGHKASKLSKALDLFSFAPATQEQLLG